MTNGMISGDEILDQLLENNAVWARDHREQGDPLFTRFRESQKPELLWIGCSDSRVPPSVITGADPGHLFIHRNIANLVHPEDSSLMATLTYALDVLGIRTIVVAGHYHCGGVRAACMHHNSEIDPSISHWIDPIRSVRDMHIAELEAISSESAREHRLSELNVLDQVERLRQTAPVIRLKERGEEVHIHGLIYDTGSGELFRLT